MTRLLVIRGRANPLKEVYKLLFLFIAFNAIDYFTAMLAISHGAVISDQ
jgi:hypothetical protein